jgi:hypothetical protein
MGPSGALDYYDNRARTEQPTAGGLGIALTSGNEALREEQADTWTIGVAMGSSRTGDSRSIGTGFSSRT